MDFWPFNQSGPDFLGFYVALAVVCFTIAMGLHRLLAGAYARAPGPPMRVRDVVIDTYEAAALGDRERGPVDAALASLVADGLVRPPKVANRVRRTGLQPAGFRSSMEKRVYALIEDGPVGTKIDAIRDRTKHVTAALGVQLEAKGLVRSLGERPHARAIAASVLLLPLVVGGLRLEQARGTERPVGFLVALMVATAIGIYVFWASDRPKVPYRTKLGVAVLERLRERGEALWQAAKRGTDMTGRDAAKVVALYGAGAFAVGSLESLGEALVWTRPIYNSGGGWGGGCGGGCGGCGGCGG